MIRPAKDLIIDSSVAAMWVLPEPGYDKAQDLLLDTTRHLVVLDLAYPEVANAIWKRVHRKLMSEEQAHVLLHEFIALKIDHVAALPLLQSASQVATRYDRSVYDALFVALVHESGGQGVTADEPLYNAVHRDFPGIHLLRTM